MTADDGNRVALFTGGCQCGAVRYALYSTPNNVGICHCRMCQKAVGGPFFAFAGLPLADLAWTRGTPGTFASSSAAERGFCANCGTPLTFRYLQRPDQIDVTLGSLDQPQQLAPTRVLGAESRLPWCDAIASLPGETTGSGTPPEDLTRIVNYQHPDADTATWQARPAN
jgi:hypothetical protein